MLRISWLISWNALRMTWRDPRSLILLLLMPTVLTFILGLSLKDVMDGGVVPSFDVWLLEASSAGSEGEGLGGSEVFTYPLMERALLSVPKETGMHLVPLKAPSDVKTRVKEGQKGVAVTIPNERLNLIPGAAVKPVSIGLWVNPDETVISLTSELVLRRVIGTLNRSLHQLPEVPPIEVDVRPSGLLPVGAMSYYAAAMGVMFMVFTAMTRAREIAEEKKMALYTRLIAAPIRRLSLGFGYIGAGMLTMWVQWLLLMFFSAVIFQVNWVHVPWVALIALVYSFAWSGIALVLATWFGEGKLLDVGGVLLSILLAALSGSMYPLYLFPDALQQLAKLTPNYWALKSVLDVLSGLELESTWPALAVLALIGLSGMFLGWLRMGVSGR